MSEHYLRSISTGEVVCDFHPLIESDTASLIAHLAPLDAAWAEVEAALPRDWMLERIFALDVDAWAADAEWDGDEDEPPAVFQLQATGRTPAAALRALAEKLTGLSDGLGDGAGGET